MIDLSYIKEFYPPSIKQVTNFDKHLLKEYLELASLEYISKESGDADKLSFIGGTNLRLVKGIDRFSEDLDFDCKDLSAEDFRCLTDGLIANFRNMGLNAIPKDKESDKLGAYRRSILFPGILYDMGLTGHREERFMLKVEAEDQQVNYQKKISTIDRCGFHINIPTPPDDVLLSMKLTALMSRGKGRDFYDAMFLMQLTEPNYEYLSQKASIEKPSQLRYKLLEVCDATDFEKKSKDFTHLLLNTAKAEIIKDFPNTVEEDLTPSLKP